MQTTDQTLITGHAYDIDSLRLLGWTEGDGSGHDGYDWCRYFDGGVYLGPDQHGIEPVMRRKWGAE